MAMDIYQQLEADHDRQRELMAAVSESCADLNERRRLFYDLCAELDAHAAAEEQTFHAALLTQSKDHERIRQRVGEHNEIAALIADLASADLGEPAWLCRFKEFMGKIDHHLDKEESGDFALARRHLDDAQAATLGERFAKLKCCEIAQWGGGLLVSPLLLSLDELASLSAFPSLMDFPP
jgi:hypothetical protein